MEELAELRMLLVKQCYPEALLLLGEMEEMARDDKANKIESFVQLVLLHLIKQQAEKRNTRSWDISIFNSRRNIERVNKRRKAGGNYLSPEEILELIEEGYPDALNYAALETLEGQHSPRQLAALVDAATVKAEAFRLITTPISNADLNG